MSSIHFPIDFIVGQWGGSVRGSVDRGSVFCRNPVNWISIICLNGNNPPKRTGLQK